MKLNLFIFLSFISSFARAQIIITYAGGGMSGLGDGGPATEAQVSDPGACIFSKKGDCFITSGTGNRIRKVDTNGVISTVAGTGSGGYKGDNGPATNAELNFPDGIALDSSGNIFFSDGLNNVIRKINISTGIITTIGGCGIASYGGDGGPATLAKLYSPNQICFDKLGNLYIADAVNNRIRRIDVNGTIRTYAGTGTAGFSGDNGPATDAEINVPTGVAADGSGNLYIADGGNYRIRKVNSSGIISTYAGNGAYIYVGDNIPATDAQISPSYLQFDRYFNIYISSASSTADGNTRVYKIDGNHIIHVVAGNGILGYSGDGGPATDAAIFDPGGLAFDVCGNLYIGDINSNRVRKVLFDPTCTYANVKVPEVVNTELVIYPNPSTDELHINNVKAETNYVLVNITGIIEQTGALKQGSNSIPIQALQSGVYLLEMVNEEGEKTVRKIVKE